MKKVTLIVLLISAIISIPILLLFVGGIVFFSLGYENRLVSLYENLLTTHQEVTVAEKTIIEENSVIIDVVEKASASVVSIAVRQVELNSELGPQNMDNNIGTGFIIGEDLIVTNQHVVSNKKADYIVSTEDGEVFEVITVYRDAVNDIALVRIDRGDHTLPILELGDSDEVKIGQLVVAIGTPLGDYPGTVTTGIVSGLNRSVIAGSVFWGDQTEYENVIQTDAAINPGNSGGPLLNSSAQVIGINFATTSGADNISFAIPSNTLKQRIEDFESNGGKFVKPYVGVVYEMIEEFDAWRFDVPQGAFVKEVASNSPAKVAGIEVGDIITKMNGSEIGNSLSHMIESFEIGQEIEVEVWRKNGDKYSDGEYMSFKLVFGEIEQ